jgi:hypothetical protein
MIYKKYATDKIGREIIVKEKDKRKKELQWLYRDLKNGINAD